MLEAKITFKYVFLILFGKQIIKKQLWPPCGYQPATFRSIKYFVRLILFCFKIHSEQFEDLKILCAQQGQRRKKLFGVRLHHTTVVIELMRWRFSLSLSPSGISTNLFILCKNAFSLLCQIIFVPPMNEWIIESKSIHWTKAFMIRKVVDEYLSGGHCCFLWICFLNNSTKTYSYGIFALNVKQLLIWHS